MEGGILVSKKKKRYLKHRRKKHHANPKANDIHHLCFMKRCWNRTYAKALRQFHYCTISLPKNTIHRIIHENMVEVPVPREIAAKSVYEQLLILDQYNVLHDNDPIEKRLILLAELFDYIAQPTADGFREQLSIIQRFKNMPP